MKAMILAAGKGERMRPLTNHTPKPLLKVGGKPLIQHHIEKLSSSGFKDLVINHSWLGGQIENFLGDGSDFGVSIAYSSEKEPLETAGGIIKALPLIGEEPFLLISGDIWTDYSFNNLRRFSNMSELAHLVMVKNPSHHLEGDFLLQEDGMLSLKESILESESSIRESLSCTYSGIGVLHPKLFLGLGPAKMALAPVFRSAVKNAQLSAEYFDGEWSDIGTIERLEDINSRYN